MTFLKIRNYVSDANSRLLPIPNDTKIIKHLLMQKRSKTSSKGSIGVAKSKVVKTANPIWKLYNLMSICMKDISGRSEIMKDN